MGPAFVVAAGPRVGPVRGPPRSGAWPPPSPATARGATIRAELIDVAAWQGTERGYLTLHLPSAWHREHEWLSLFQSGCGPPRAHVA